MSEQEAVLKSSAATLGDRPEEFANLVDQLTADPPFTGRERRVHPRRPFCAPVTVQPLDDSLQPAGQPFGAVSRDISVGGIGLLLTRAVAGRYLLLKLTGPDGNEVEVVVEVRRCQSRGLAYDVGCSFVEGTSL